MRLEDRGPVLVVDDDPFLREFVVERLRSAGWPVVAVPGGQEALAALHAMRVGAVLLDVDMPGLDGLELARLIRADPALASIPLVACTARGQPEDLAAQRAAGCDGCIAKPIHPRTFVREFQRSIEQALLSRGRPGAGGPARGVDPAG